MGEVVSFAKARQTDIFSIFDSTCPTLPEDTDREVVQTAKQSVGVVDKKNHTTFRAAFMLIAALSFFGVVFSIASDSNTGHYVSRGAGASLKEPSAPRLASGLNAQAVAEIHYPSSGVFSSSIVATDEFTVDTLASRNPAWRHSREAWLAHIAALENHPYYQQVLREKRLFSLTHPDRSE